MSNEECVKLKKSCRDYCFEQSPANSYNCFRSCDWAYHCEV